MPCSLFRNVGPVLLAAALVAGLGACGVHPGYMAEQLHAVPVPASALMAKAPPPECQGPPDPEPAPAKAQPEASKTEPDSEPEESDTRTSEISNETEQTPGPAEADMKTIERERDCYRQAEQRARARLDKLQASAADTVATLDKIKSQLQASEH